MAAILSGDNSPSNGTQLAVSGDSAEGYYSRNSCGKASVGEATMLNTVPGSTRKTTGPREAEKP